MMTAAEYVSRVVEPTLHDFREHRADLRRGMLASMAVLHVVDFVMQNREATPQNGDAATIAFKKRAVGINAGFQLVNRFALASKHGALLRDPFDTNRHRVLSNSPLFAFGLLGAGPTDLALVLDDKTIMPLQVALDATMALYRVEFPEAFGPSQLAGP